MSAMVELGLSPGRLWPVWLSWGRASIYLLEENKEGPLCNRKSHFMKLCNALGPIGGGEGNGEEHPEESFSFCTLKEDADRHHRDSQP